MALLMGPLAVKAQARFPRCSSVCGSIVRFLLRSSPECCWPSTLPMSSLISPVSQSCSRSFHVSARTFRHLSQQQAAAMSAQSGPGLMATDGSLKAFCPSWGIARDYAAWDGHCRDSAKIGKWLLVAFCDNDVANGAVWKRAVVEGVALAASCEEFGVQCANPRALHPGVQVVNGPGRYHQQ